MIEILSMIVIVRAIFPENNKYPQLSLGECFYQLQVSN